MAVTAPRPPLAPVAIGGVGGSGTRLVAELLRAVGVHMGDDLNDASDNLWFTLLFKRIDVLDCSDEEFSTLAGALVAGLRGGPPLSPCQVARARALAGQDRPQHSPDWLEERADSLARAAAGPRRDGPWGWKEPNTHVVIERLWACMPGLKYIHVVRNGLDMAYSSNQNQLAYWSTYVLGEPGPVTPARSLAYWCRVHRRIRALHEAHPSRLYWLDYDALCRTPVPGLAALAGFLGIEPGTLLAHADRVQPPRPPRHAIDRDSGFDEDDIAFVRSLGYAVATS